MIVDNITALYTPLDAWVYDYFFTDPALTPWEGMLDTVAAYFAGCAAQGTVLDVGSGGGQIVVAIARRNPTVRVDGIDSSAAQVHRATRRASDLDGRARFREGLADNLPFPDNSFDVVMSSGSVKHWPDPAAGIREMLRVLRPGGLFFVNDLDRGCQLQDMQTQMTRTRVPRFMRSLATMFARTYMAGRSLDLDDARALAASVPLGNVVVERIAGQPLIQIHARKAHM